MLLAAGYEGGVVRRAAVSPRERARARTHTHTHTLLGPQVQACAAEVLAAVAAIPVKKEAVIQAS